MPPLDPRDLTPHIDRLYRAAWAMCGSRHDAEDLVQETFAQVLARPRWVRRGYELPYLLRALRNTFINSRRSAMRRPMTVAQLEDVEPADPHSLGDPNASLEVQEVYGAIANLSEDFRAAIVSIDVMGLSYKEAARALGVKEATITTRLHRARAQVAKQVLGEQGQDDDRALNPRGDPESALASKPPRTVREGSPSEGVIERRTDL